MNAYKRFRPISLAPLAYNGAMIFAALVLVRVSFGGAPLGIVGLAWGVALGGFLHLLVQVPSLRRLGWRIVSLRDIRHPGVRQVALLMVPISIGLTASQINVAVDRYLGVSLPPGGISALYFANNLAAVPIGVFTSARAVVMFPYFARHATLGEIDQLRRRATLAVRLNLFVMLPAAVGLIVLGPQIIALLFQHGSFSTTSSAVVYPPLAFFAIGVAAQASVFIVVRVYYSFQEVVTPMKIAFVAVVTNLVANLILVHPLGAGGLALGTSLAAILNFVLLVRGLHSRLHGFEGRRLATSLLRVAVGCAVLAAVGYGAWRLLAGEGPVTLDLRHYAALAIAIALAGAAYLGAEILLRAEEVAIALDIVRRRPAAL
jgi:putative peptidoglycan lipid II flippase